jgi:hypothetical protein
MTDKKITQLTEIEAPSPEDFLAIVDVSSNETKKVKASNLLSNGDITSSNLRLQKMMEPFLGFDDGTTDTEIFSGAGRTPQGIAYAEVSGAEKLYVLQRTAGSTYALDERHRIVEYNLASNGSVASNVQFTAELNVGHGQDLSAVVSGSNVTFYCQNETLTGYTGQDAGKGFSKITYDGSSTVQADVTSYQVFGYSGSGHRFEDFYNATVGVDESGKYLVMLANDQKTNVDDTGHNLFIYDLSVLEAASDPLDILPLVGPLPITPSTMEQTVFLQGCAITKNQIALLRGYSGVFDHKLIEVYDFNGQLIKRIDFDGTRSIYSISSLLDNASLGVPSSFEPEGISWYKGELLSQFTDFWSDVGDIVTWEGSNWACISDNTGEPPASSTYWTRTDKTATAGAWSSATAYSAGANYNRKSKVIFKVGPETGSVSELPMLNGSANLLPLGFPLGQNANDISYKWDTTFNVSSYIEAIADYRRAFGYYDGRVMRMFDGREGSSNSDYVSFAVNFESGREVAEFRINGSVGEGSAINLYGKDDSSFGGAIRAWSTEADGTAVEVLKIDVQTPAATLRLEGLPTSSSGLPSGSVWNDGGTLKIV